MPAWNARPVLCLDDGRRFESATAAAEACGLSVPTVSETCREVYRVLGVRGESVNRLHLIYHDEPMSEAERRAKIIEIEERLARRRKKVEVNDQPNRGVIDGCDELGRSAAGPMMNARRVICLDDGREFPSASAAAREYNIARSAIIELCLGKNGRITVGGKVFQYR